MISILRVVVPSEPCVDEYCRWHLFRTMPRFAQLVEVRQAATVTLDLTHNLLPNYLSGLNQCEYDTVFVCEWDCLYHETYFRRTVDPRNITYAQPSYYLLCRNNTWRFAKRRSVPLSSLAGNRDVIRKAMFAKFSAVAKTPNLRWRAEITKQEGLRIEHHELAVPWIDIRHGKNATTGVITGEHVNTLEPWGDADLLWKTIHESPSCESGTK